MELTAIPGQDRSVNREDSEMIVRQLGRADYEPTFAAMKEFTASRTAETPDELWVVEHPPVFTLGQAGKPNTCCATPASRW